MAGAFGWIVIVVVIALLWTAGTAMFRSENEDIKRLRTVLLGVVGLLFAVAVFNMGGPEAVVITAAVLGAAWWIYRGFKR